MTSNLGSQFLLDGIKEDRTFTEGTEDKVMQQLRMHFRPEFLNRIDDIIIFKPLTKNEIAQIVKLTLKDLNKRLEERNLSREEILKSSSLISAMSMLTALCLDYEASEDWYRELQNYAAKLKKTDSEYKSVQGKLAYLDISLPQRGSKGLIKIIGNVFQIMKDKQLNVPSFSVKIGRAHV